MIKKIFKLALISCFTITLSVIAINQFIYYTGYFENTSVADNKAPVHFYVINLDRQPEKFAKLKAQTDRFGINLTRFPAIDGYKITLVDQDTKEVLLGSDIKNTNKLQRNHKYSVYCTTESYANDEKPEFVYEAFKNYPKMLSPGELGLLCTSRILWKQVAIANHNQISIVFEDDALLFPDFDKNVKTIISSLPIKWDITYLDGTFNYNNLRKNKPLSWSNIFRFPTTVIDNSLIKLPTAIDIFRTHGYALHTHSAQKLLDLQSQNSGIPLDNLFSESIKYRRLIAYLSKTKIMSYDSSLLSDISIMGR